MKGVLKSDRRCKTERRRSPPPVWSSRAAWMLIAIGLGGGTMVRVSASGSFTIEAASRSPPSTTAPCVPPPAMTGAPAVPTSAPSTMPERPSAPRKFPKPGATSCAGGGPSS